MAIPAFDARGYLPPGRHTATEADVKAQFVDAFNTSLTRAQIYEGWVQHRKAVQDIAPIKSQWVNGSFVTAAVDPADVDVVTFFDASDVNALPRHRALVLRILMLDKYTSAFWGCDSYPLVEPHPTDPAHAVFVQTRDYWENQWGHDRNNVAKGFLEVP